ncbi:MAG: DUF58 domain-containing protein [Nocardioidaceae bacterium]
MSERRDWQLEWVTTTLTRRVMALAVVCIVLLVLAPQPSTAAALGVTLLVLAGLLVDRRPDALVVSASIGRDHVNEGGAVEALVSLGPAGVPLHASAHLELVPTMRRIDRSRWRLVPGAEPLRIPVRAARWQNTPPGVVAVHVVSRRGGWTASTVLPLPTLHVHPVSHSRPRTSAPPAMLSRLGSHPSRLRGRGGDFAELREYVRGDALRDVNWKSSARAGELMVTERHRDQAADVVILLDRASPRGSYDRRLLDRSVRSAAALTRSFLRAGDRVALVAFGAVTRSVPLGQGRAHELRLLDELSTEPETESFLEPEIARVPPSVLPPRAMVYCFSPLLDARVVALIGHLAERGHRIVTIDSEGIEPRAWPKGLHPATREVWLTHRRSLRSNLADIGVVVVDSVEAVAPAVRAFAAGRLR